MVVINRASIEQLYQSWAPVSKGFSLAIISSYLLHLVAPSTEEYLALIAGKTIPYRLWTVLTSAFFQDSIFNVRRLLNQLDVVATAIIQAAYHISYNTPLSFADRSLYTSSSHFITDNRINARRKRIHQICIVHSDSIWHCHLFLSHVVVFYHDHSGFKQ